MADNPLKKLYEAMEMYEIRDTEKQAEIDRLKSEKQALTERVKKLEEQLKALQKRSKDDPIMQMYEAQAIAIEKEMEVDKLKEENDKLKMEQDGLLELLKWLEKDQKAAGTSIEPASRNIELDSLKQRDKEKEAKMEEMKKKNEELGERLEMNRERERRKMIIENPVIKQTQRNTILVIPPFARRNPLILSANRSRWIELQLKLTVPRRGGAVYLNEEIYLTEESLRGKSLFKLDKNLKWIRFADMNENRWGITNSCLEWNGCIWVLGGHNKVYLQSVERYDPNENKWTPMPDMRYSRCFAAAAVWNNHIVISGGWTFPSLECTGECFNLENGCWTELPNMPKTLRDHSLISYKNKLIIMGGYDGRELNDVWQLDPQETNPKWKQLPSMKCASRSFAGIVLDEEIYAIGGKGDGDKELDRVEIFDGKQWRDGPSLPCAMSNMSAMIIPQHYADRLCNYEPE